MNLMNKESTGKKILRRAIAFALALCAAELLFFPAAAGAGVVRKSSAQKAAASSGAAAGAGDAEQGTASIVSGAGAAAGETAKIHGGGTMFSVAELPGDAAAGRAAAPPREAKVVTGTLFDGGELMLVAPLSASQMESFIITTKSGKLIVVDGGTEEDAPHLKSLLLERGGHVSAWLVTHPHSDHVGAMTALLNEADPALTIDGVYYRFASLDWYKENEVYRSDVVERCMQALSRLSPGANRGDIRKGDVIQIDDVSIRVMNDPYLFPVNAINNSSVAYRVEMNGKRILFLGDMGVQAGESLKTEYLENPGELKADIVQMAHHGQRGVDRTLYELIRPQISLWCCPRWLWDNDSGGGVNSGTWRTLEVRGWMRQLGVKTHVVAKDGDQVLR